MSLHIHVDSNTMITVKRFDLASYPPRKSLGDVALRLQNVRTPLSLPRGVAFMSAFSRRLRSTNLSAGRLLLNY